MPSAETPIIPVLERRKPKNVVEAVEPGGAAERAGLRVGDRVTAVNGARLRDIVDWRFHTAGEQAMVAFERDGVGDSVTITKGYEEDLGLSSLTTCSTASTSARTSAFSASCTSSPKVCGPACTSRTMITG
jgi:predicted metalloprotease with PDZ domain